MTRTVRDCSSPTGTPCVRVGPGSSLPKYPACVARHLFPRPIQREAFQSCTQGLIMGPGYFCQPPYKSHLLLRFVCSKSLLLVSALFSERLLVAAVRAALALVKFCCSWGFSDICSSSCSKMAISRSYLAMRSLADASSYATYSVTGLRRDLPLICTC